MLGWFSHILQHLSAHPIQQALLVAFATLFLEDPTAMACGLLIADGQMNFWTAYLGISFGIAFGDVTLYWLGRALGPKIIQWRLLPPDRLDRVRGWFNRNIILTVLVARFVPGMRLPTYVGAGIFKASAIRFLGLALIASLSWILLLLVSSVLLGQAIFPKLGKFKWPVAILVLGLFVAFQWMLAHRQARQVRKTDIAEYQSPVSLFEFWPAWLFYIPLILYYIYLAIRFRGPTLPSAVNPYIFAGGLLGDSKSALLDLVPETFRERVASWVCLKIPDPPLPLNERLELAKAALARSGLDYPLVAKPDIGHRGAGVQPVRNEEQLRQYLEIFPSGKPLLLQKLIDLPGEAGIVYCRKPGEIKGKILSLTLKQFPFVTGDGHRTLRELIMSDERAAIIHETYFRRHRRQLERILAQGEIFPLVFTGNHRQGAVLKNGNALITLELTAVTDELAKAIPEFYYGRFEVRFAKLESFLAGIDFVIIEINGAGAQVLHIWDAKTSLLEAYRSLCAQWRLLFEIGASNRRRGFKPLGWRMLGRAARAHFQPLVHYPPAQ